MSLSEFRMLSHFPAEAKVSKFDMVGVIDKNVGRLDVSMDDLSSSAFLIGCSIMAVLKC